MPTLPLYDMEGNQVGEVGLDARVFAAGVNEPVLHQVVVKQLAERRSGTAAVKTRAEVRGGGRKPWRQKGTGRARAGSTRSPVWRKGGVVFGPEPRNYGFRIPKKINRLALCSALSAKVEEENLVVLTDLVFNSPKTKEGVKFLEMLRSTGRALVVTADQDEQANRAVRNLPQVKYLTVKDLNVYDLLAYDKLVLTKEALARLEEAL